MRVVSQVGRENSGPLHGERGSLYREQSSLEAIAVAVEDVAFEADNTTATAATLRFIQHLQREKRSVLLEEEEEQRQKQVWPDFHSLLRVLQLKRRRGTDAEGRVPEGLSEASRLEE